ncbi:MAG TPA: hypothetical protein PK926_09495 [Spirochaetota bacterium]|nr:hypothetical protein [Spirochaetota bacterium]HPI90707.1 hypothetical protein [Spirochaetota bacterium]HPR49974.1 hypothetical protein [Spirochaetota bacterium]
MIRFKNYVGIIIVCLCVAVFSCDDESGVSGGDDSVQPDATVTSDTLAKGTDEQTVAESEEDAGDDISAAALLSEDEVSSVKDSIWTVVDNIPDAENAFFTDTGRLFVTGGNSLFEIIDGYSAVRVLHDAYGIFGGIAQSGKWLYVIYHRVNLSLGSIDLCSAIKSGNYSVLFGTLSDGLMKKSLYRADLSAASDPEDLVFEEVHEFENMFLPNGLAADSEGSLYVTDYTILPCGQIVKLVISDDETPVITQETWLSYKTGACAPNGIVIRDDVVYYTDFLVTGYKQARVKKVAIENGAAAGKPEIIYSAFGMFDDLDVSTYRGDPVVAIANYMGNSIILFNETTEEASKLGYGKFICPSSVHFGSGDLFDSNELIVTEKGIMYETYSSIGNKVKCMSIPE